MSEEQYLLMCEQMGVEPDPDELPKDSSDLTYEAQQSLMLFNILPDKIEGMAGIWLGKDMAGISDIMDIYEIENKRRVLELFIMIVNVYSKHYSEKKSAKKGRK